jgi:hypothetical protein
VRLARWVAVLALVAQLLVERPVVLVLAAQSVAEWLEVLALAAR